MVFGIGKKHTDVVPLSSNPVANPVAVPVAVKGQDPDSHYRNHKRRNACLCCLNLDNRTAHALILLLSLVFIGLNAAALSAYKSGWAYYKEDHFTFPPLTPVLGPQPYPFRVWVGWVKGTDTLRKIIHGLNKTSPQLPLPRQSEYKYLKDEEYAAQVVGGITAGFLCINILIGLVYVAVCLSQLFTKKKATEKKITARSLWFFPGAGAIAQALLTIALYILIAIGVSRAAERELGDKKIPWPHWAWILSMSSCAFLAAVSAASRLLPRHGLYSHGTPVGVYPPV